MKNNADDQGIAKLFQQARQSDAALAPQFGELVALDQSQRIWQHRDLLGVAATLLIAVIGSVLLINGLEPNRLLKPPVTWSRWDSPTRSLVGFARVQPELTRQLLSGKKYLTWTLEGRSPLGRSGVQK